MCIEIYPEFMHNYTDDQLVSGSSDGSVKVWDMDTLNCVHTLESHTADVNCIVAKV